MKPDFGAISAICKINILSALLVFSWSVSSHGAGPKTPADFLKTDHAGSYVLVMKSLRRVEYHKQGEAGYPFVFTPFTGTVFEGDGVTMDYSISSNIGADSNGIICAGSEQFSQQSFLTQPVQTGKGGKDFHIVGDDFLSVYVTPYYCSHTFFDDLWSNIINVPVKVLPRPTLDLIATEVRLSGENMYMELDGTPASPPGKSLTAEVIVTGTGLNANESRTGVVQLKVGDQIFQKEFPIASLKSSSSSVTINFNLPQVPGDLKIVVVVNPTNSLAEINQNNNTLERRLHVLCNIASTGKVMKFWSQASGSWASKKYAKTSKTLKDLGCYTTSLTMVFDYHGINKGLNGKPIDPGLVNDGFNSILYEDLGPQYKEYGGYDSDGNIQPEGAAVFARSSYYNACMTKIGDRNGCQQASKKAMSFRAGMDKFDADVMKNIDKEICAGNPVILKVPRSSTPKNRVNGHFIVATAMRVDSNGNPAYLTNNPGSSKGEKVLVSAIYDKIIGYRVYRPLKNSTVKAMSTFASDSSDEIVSKLVLDIPAKVSVVVTDSQGRRLGYNPQLGETYSEIPNATMLTSDSVGSDTNASVFTLPHSRLEILSPADGNFKVQVFSSSATTYTLTGYNVDINGEINDITSITKSIGVNSVVESWIYYTSSPLMVRRTSLISKATKFSDAKYKSMAGISAIITLPKGRTISFTDALQVKVGTFEKRIAKKDTSVISISKHNHYVYSVPNEMMLDIDSVTGQVVLYITNSGLYNGQTTISVSASIQVDDLLATGAVTFKNVKKVP